MKKDQVKKIEGKKVSIRSVDFVKKQKIKGYNKFQLFLCKIIMVRPAIHYVFFFNINYYGRNNLQVKDVLTDSEGNIYTVINNINRVALIASYTKFQDKPNIGGFLNIEGRKVQSKK